MSEGMEKNRRILIIDDNEAIHADFRSILVGDGPDVVDLTDDESAIFGKARETLAVQVFEVDSALQGKEGLEKIRQALAEKRPYAMAFVDVRMPPGWDGIETIKRIWQEYAGLQVVICTAYSDYKWKDIIDVLGFTEKLLILKKPFDSVEVYQLASALTEKWHLSWQAHLKQKELEHLVKMRTKELSDALEKAKEAAEAKGQFLANMSHEIRTPMNSVIGFSDVLAQESLTTEQHKYVRLIQGSGRHLMGIINDILDFSKVEAGKLDMKITGCNLGSILIEIESAMRPEAEKKGLEFKISRCEGLPERIRTDSGRLRQCLINLVGNAIKFTGQGHVYVNVCMQEGDESGYIRFDVEDTGIGIAPDKQELIFESFKQADGGASREYGGTGLGLAITRELAELLGGRLSVSSRLGSGSVFSLLIPSEMDFESSSFSDDTDDSVSGGGDLSSTGSGRRFCGQVLVAEDCKTNQMLIKVLLERLGLEVTVVEDGDAAIEKAVEGGFDLIFMDMYMPNISGYEATKSLRESGVETPVIALTANVLEGDRGKCLNAGCDDYLAKPIKQDALVAVIAKYLGVAERAAESGSSCDR